MRYVILVALFISVSSIDALCGDEFAIIMRYAELGLSNAVIQISNMDVSLPSDFHKRSHNNAHHSGIRRTYEGPRTNVLDMLTRLGVLYNASIKADPRYAQEFPAPCALEEITITNNTIAESLQMIIDTCSIAGFPQVRSNGFSLAVTSILFCAPKMYYLGVAYICDDDMNSPKTTRLNPDVLFSVAPHDATGHYDRLPPTPDRKRVK